MSEDGSEGTPQQNREAEKLLEPWQAVMNKARYEVIKHCSSLQEAGVTEKQVKEAARIAGERAKQEFEEQQEINPLFMIQQAIHDTAETEDEKLLSEQVTDGNITFWKKRWEEILKEAAIAASLKGEAFSCQEAIRAAVRTPALPMERKGQLWPQIELLRTRNIGGRLISPSKDFLTRILKGLGVLQERHSINNLSSLPQKTETEEGPRFRPSYNGSYWRAERLPVNAFGKGVEMNLKVSTTGNEEHELVVVFSPSVFEEKVVQLPRTEDLSFEF